MSGSRRKRNKKIPKRKKRRKKLKFQTDKTWFRNYLLGIKYNL